MIVGVVPDRQIITQDVLFEDAMQTSPLLSILILLSISVVLVGGFRRFNLPSILAFLIVGIAVGPHALAWIPSLQQTHIWAEFGVVFLLFTVGLEFSLPQLLAMRGAVFGLGGVQVALSVMLAGGVAWWLGMSPAASLVVGGILAMSSTAIASKQLGEQFELNGEHGRLALSILLFQDLAVIPFLLIIPNLAQGPDALLLNLSWAFAKAVLLFVGVYVLGNRVLRPLFHAVATVRSPELFTLAALLVALAAAWSSQAAGLSLALGAFLAGMMLGETQYRYQIEADIRPFRDVLLGLFFITVGMLLDLHGLPRIWPWVLLLGMLLILFKFVLVSVICWASGREPEPALRAGLVLAQGGEFGFALLSLALGAKVLDPLSGQVVLAALLLSMALAPLLIRYNAPLAAWILAHAPGRKRLPGKARVAEYAQPLQGHVIICGYGRVGQNIARFLEQESVDFFALDLDPQRVRSAREAGELVAYGDGTRREILEAAGINRARLLVIAFDDGPASLHVLTQTRELRPDMPVLVRARDDAFLEQFKAAGATEVVAETLEASLMLGSHLLLLLNVPGSRVMRLVRSMRGDRYRLLRGYFHGQAQTAIDEADSFRERLHPVNLPDGAHAVGKTLAELDLEARNILVSAVRRGGIRGPEPSPHTRLRAGDVLVLYGTPENLESAESLLLRG